MSNEILLECRAEYAVGTFIFILQWMVQWRKNGFRGWSWGDFMSISAWLFFTVLYAELETISKLPSPMQRCSV